MKKRITYSSFRHAKRIIELWQEQKFDDWVKIRTKRGFGRDQSSFSQVQGDPVLTQGAGSDYPYE